MLEEQLKEVIEKFGLKDEKAITFGHPKMKMKWILPLPGITGYSFEQFQIPNSSDNYTCFAIVDLDGNKIEISYYDK